MSGGSYYRLSVYQCYETLTLLVYMSYRVPLVKPSFSKIGHYKWLAALGFIRLISMNANLFHASMLVQNL